MRGPHPKLECISSLIAPRDRLSVSWPNVNRALHPTAEFDHVGDGSPNPLAICALVRKNAVRNSESVLRLSAMSGFKPEARSLQPSVVTEWNDGTVRRVEDVLVGEDPL